MNLILNMLLCETCQRHDEHCHMYVAKATRQVYDSLPPHSAWNQQSPLSRKLAKEGRLVAIIRSIFNIHFPVIDA